MTYPLNAAERRQKQISFYLDSFRRTAKKHQYADRQLREEYRRVSAIYARHLERLSAKAAQLVTDQQTLQHNLDEFTRAWGLTVTADPPEPLNPA